MWLRTRGYKNECATVQDALERISIGESDRVVALSALLERLRAGEHPHIDRCGDCRSFADELLQVRGLFEREDNGAQPGPYFIPRVMAAIADREREIEKSSQTWAVVPRLAYRLSVLASLTLLLAGSWLYQQPRHTTIAGVSTGQSTEGLVEGSGSTIQDDFLLNMADR
jgi:hypothetical protein